MSKQFKYSFNSKSFKFSPDLSDSEDLEVNKLINIANKLKIVKDKKTLTELINHLFNHEKL